MEQFRRDANYKRKNERRKISEMWSEGTDGRDTCIEAEIISVKILENEGFTGIHLLSEINRYFPFDIRSVDNKGKICLFQVTTRTHKEIRDQKKLAYLLGIEEIYLLFIKPDLSSYILKRVPYGVNSYEISFSDINKSRQIEKVEYIKYSNEQKSILNFNEEVIN